MIGLLYEMIYIAVISAGLLSVFMPLFGYESAGFIIVLITAFLAGVPALFKKSGWIGRLIISGITVTLIIAGFLLRGNAAVNMFLSVHTEWIPVLIIAVSSFAVGELTAHVSIFRLLITVGSLAALITAVILDVKPEKLTVAAVLVLILLTLIEEIQKRWIREGYTDSRKHLVFVMPFVILAMIPVLLIPAPDDPYDWALFKRIYKSVSESIERFGRRFSTDGVYDPTEALIGFSSNGDLHGTVKHANDEVMELIDLSSAVTGVRLGGRTFDTFDGSAWTDTDDSAGYDELLDTVAFFVTVRENADNPDDYTRRHSFRISYTGISTPYVFAPLKSLVGNNGYDPSISYKSGDIMWDGSSVPDEYWVSFYRMNTQNPVFNELIEKAQVPGKEEYDACLAEMSLPDTTCLSYDDYLEHRSRVYEIYSGAPEISDELREYLDALYDGADSETEKMDRLCNMMRHFEYTNAPGELPEYVTDAESLLDYFILDSRRGYCSYFATAFVLLARAEGLPARYVQGYLTETKGQRNVTVYSYMAHAWPEVYYDGIGWVAYEPTPGMGIYSYWRTTEESAALGQSAASGYPGAQEEEGEEGDMGPRTDSPEEEGPVIPVRAIVISVTFGICFIILFYIIGNVIAGILFRKKKTEVRYRIICRQNMYILKLLGFDILQGETLSEYGVRIGGKIGPETAVFIDDMTDYLYAEASDCENPEKRALEYRTGLLKRLRKENFIKFLAFYLGLRKTK